MFILGFCFTKQHQKWLSVLFLSIYKVFVTRIVYDLNSDLPLLFCLEFSQCAVDSTIPTTVDICQTPTVRPNPRTCNVGRTETRIITTAISPKPTARTTHSTDGTRGPVPWTVSPPPPPANPSAGEASPIQPRPQSTGPRLPLTSSV